MITLDTAERQRLAALATHLDNWHDPVLLVGGSRDRVQTQEPVAANAIRDLLALAIALTDERDALRRAACEAIDTHHAA